MILKDDFAAEEVRTAGVVVQCADDLSRVFSSIEAL